jgi:type II secretory pathway component GspD/PulD (secretin)
MVQAKQMMPAMMSDCSVRQCLLDRRQLIGCLLTWFLTVSAASQGATPDAHLVAVDFENVDVRVFIKFVSEVTGRVFLLDDRVRGQVSVRFVHKIPVDQLADVLESVLEVKGFATIPAGPITKITPLSQAKQQGIEVTGSGPSGSGSRR